MSVDIVGAAEAASKNSGSRWLRWDPHIHAPGTVMSNQFKGDTAWEDYLTALEEASPTISAMGITDYYVTDSYEKVREFKDQGRLASCHLVFPNIELRIAVGTLKGGFVNVHLLVSPEDPDHVVKLQRFLQQLSFRAANETYTCTKADLIALGEKHAPNTKGNEKAALEAGATQFKVALDQLKSAFHNSEWARTNILVGVAGAEHDGTSGVRDAADQMLRIEIEKMAQIIFSSSVAQRDFWLGRKGISTQDLWEKYDGPKPCLHGCDAHKQVDVAKPALDRYSWIKGAPAFDTLRQAWIDPEMRAFVGCDPPGSIYASQVIRSIRLEGADWAKTPELSLNPGLVAIIGARGSGKTALADMIARGCDSYEEDKDKRSFLARAKPLLGETRIVIEWEGSEPVTRSLVGQRFDDEDYAYERVRYLSQQFVENLCSADGMTDGLLREVERVVFEAQPTDEVGGAGNFDEYREDMTIRFRSARQRHEDALGQIADRIGAEQEKRRSVTATKTTIQSKENQLKDLEADRKRLVVAGDEVRATRLAEVSLQADRVKVKIRRLTQREQSIAALRDEVSGFRDLEAPELLRKAQDKYPQVGMTPDDWEAFLLDYKGDVGGRLDEALKEAKRLTESWRGKAVAQPDDSDAPLIAVDKDLERQPLSLLQAEIDRLEGLVSIDKDKREKMTAISGKISTENIALTTLREKLTDCEGAAQRIQQLVAERQGLYAKVFEAIVGEESVLNNLYAPLRERLDTSGGSLGKLSFAVRRVADVSKWASAGEDLLDLRRKSDFKGKGSIAQKAEELLRSAWETGTAADAGTAMTDFREKYDQELIEQARGDTSDAGYRAWLKSFATWLYGTDHISIQYSINYDGIDITKLSPGTRGIVLLLLYLALDDKDDRPLIIDQPEENLDPKSVFDELVGLFVQAKAKRQVIMVTHNANLVINTDADQIIIANSEPHERNALPAITYTSGGLETEAIRTAVCDILEGGESAFQERARRLRVGLRH